MIKADQPTIFKDSIIAAVSSKEDGTMKTKGQPDQEDKQTHQHRRQFLEKNNITTNQTILVQMNYDSDDFTRYDSVESASPPHANQIDRHHPNDALATKNAGIALFLPLADCVGAILYDPIKKVLMVSHLGRHNTEQTGASRSVEYMKNKFGAQPEDILVWLSPAAGSDQYPLHAFKNKSLHEVNKEHLISAGVLPQNIEVSTIDTTTHEGYHSHSEFLKGKRDEAGRFAIVAMMPE